MYNKLSKAIIYYKKAIGYNPFYTDAYYYLGLVYFYIGEYDEAIKNFNQVLKIDPVNNEVKNMLTQAEGKSERK